MSPALARAAVGAAMAALIGVPACRKDNAAPAGPPEPAPSAGSSAAPPPPGTVRYAVAPVGQISYLLDAPLEKGKGRWTKFRGALDIDVEDLSRTRGRIEMDADDLVTYTFDDPEKNATQTEHAHNWLEIGRDVAPATRAAYRWARFEIGTIDTATPRRLADAVEQDGGRAVNVVARGTVWLHGIESAKTVKLSAHFQGPPDAPTSISLRSVEPFPISLRDHDVKARDKVGQFIVGALEVVVRNRKIVDTVQVSIDDVRVAPAGERAK